MTDRKSTGRSHGVGRLRLIADLGPTMLSYVDAQYRYRWINKAYEQWFNCAAEAVQGLHIRELLGDDAWAAVQPYAQRALGGEIVTYEQELPLGKWGSRWLRATYTPDVDNSGKVRGFVVHAIDIGESKKAEAIQRATLNLLEDFDEEKSKLQLVQQATMNLLEDFDAERTNFRLVQKAMLNLLEDMQEERSRLDATQQALMNMLEDIETERSKVEQAKVQLEATNRELEAFSYSVSHDLRAPLRAVSGFSQAVEEDYAPRLDENGKRYLRLIQDNVHRMGKLIDDLLTFSRLGRQQIRTGTIDMEQLARTVFAELISSISDCRLELTISRLPPAHGDEPMVQQVLSNLLQNAIKFTRGRKNPVIEVGYLPEAGGGAYFVRDNGAGFDMKYVGKLFGVFQRLHDAADFEGTGVGLALVHRIITRHGGRVWAEGKLDQGATFFFTLPEGGIS